MSGDYHGSRFAHDARRETVWKALWRYYFRHHIAPDDAVLDLGAGYGDFINNVVARRRVAVDQWVGLKDHVSPGVEAITASATDLSAIADGSIDYAFASNLVEHLSQEAFKTMLGQVRSKLSARGCLALLQPNYRYAYREYFDDYTHVTAYSHISLADFMTANGWAVEYVHPRFLPLTVKSRVPISPFLIGLYLRSPLRPLGKQMFLVARPS